MRSCSFTWSFCFRPESGGRNSPLLSRLLAGPVWHTEALTSGCADGAGLRTSSALRDL